MVVERKEEIRELLEIVSDYGSYLPNIEFFRRDEALPLPTFSCPRAVVDVYEAMAFAALGMYTNAVSEAEVFERFGDIARQRLIFEIDLEDMIQSPDDLLSNLRPHLSAGIGDLPIGNVYLLASVLEKCSNPEIYGGGKKDKEIFDGMRLSTTLAAYAAAHFMPPISPAQAKSILTTIVDNVKEHTEISRADYTQEGWAKTTAQVSKAYQQIEMIFEGP